jgi:hypothetical protein
MTGLLRDDDDEDGVGDREPREPLLPLDSRAISVPVPPISPTDAEKAREDAAKGSQKPKRTWTIGARSLLQ